MKPIRPLTKFFLLVVQEECERTINNGISPLPDFVVLSESNLASANVNTNNFGFKGKHQHPQCTHCGLQGYTIESAISYMDIHWDINPNCRIHQVMLTLIKPLFSLMTKLLLNQC